VISGDYKVQNDGISEPFESIKCDHFITECTFGLPAFKWENNGTIQNQINQWWSENAQNNRPSIIGAYALGKAQRIMTMVDPSIGPIYGHGAIENVNEVLRNQGIKLPNSEKIGLVNNKTDYSKALIIAPPSALQSSWVDKFKDHSSAVASGWMAIRGTRRRRNVDMGFVVSDHADWKGLLEAIKATGAQNIYTTHGYTDIFARYLNEIGYKAKVVATDYGEEGDIDI
jgi:putative mRNA 3-end processing factor